MKSEVKKELKNGVIAIIRCKDFDIAKLMCDTILQSGIKAVEITSTITDFYKLIGYLKKTYKDALIGAGTILDLKNAKLAKEYGCDFIVSPYISKEVGKFCKENDILCSMGALTVNEAIESLNAGSDIVKLFPGEFFGPKFIKNIKGPLPDIDIMPTGGVNENTIGEWFAAGAYAVGVGGFLTKGITKDNLDTLKQRCEILKNSLK